jgi:maltose-binding protein MalE
MVKGSLFEFFDAEKTKLTVKKGRSKGSFKRASEYEKALDDFAESDEDAAGVWYHGEGKRLSGVAAALRKIAAEKGYHVSVAVAETADCKKAILLSKLSEADFKEIREDKLKHKKSK